MWTTAFYYVQAVPAAGAAVQQRQGEWQYDGGS
jgi:hypothetical protein